jgi:hypothetical protein
VRLKAAHAARLRRSNEAIWDRQEPSINSLAALIADFINSSAPRRRVTPVEEGSIQEIVG